MLPIIREPPTLNGGKEVSYGIQLFIRNREW
jgi:hypothetical protein